MIKPSTPGTPHKLDSDGVNAARLVRSGTADPMLCLKLGIDVGWAIFDGSSVTHGSFQLGNGPTGRSIVLERWLPHVAGECRSIVLVAGKLPDEQSEALVQRVMMYAETNAIPVLALTIGAIKRETDAGFLANAIAVRYTACRLCPEGVGTLAEACAVIGRSAVLAACRQTGLSDDDAGTSLED